MIKFNCLIHKETGTVIKYEDWCESTRDYLRIGEKKFNPRDVLFSDDFEIIYDSEFTTEELRVINEMGLGTFTDEYDGTGLFEKEMDIAHDLKNKIDEMIEKREFNRFNYGIEV